MSGEKSIEKNYLYNLMYQMLVVVIPLLTTPYVARVLHADGIGAFSYTSAITGYFVLIANLGVATYGQLKISLVRNDKYKLSKVFYELLIIRLILMIFVILGYLVFINKTADLIYKNLYYALIIQIVAASMDITWVLQGLEEFKKIVVRNIFVKILNIILIFICVKHRNDLIVYAIIMNGSTLIGDFSIWAFLSNRLTKVEIRNLNLLQHIKPCLIYFVPTIATTIYLTLDKTMIGWFTDTPLENGYYEQAHKIEQMAVTVITSLSTVTMPRMTFLYSNNKIDEMKKKLLQSVRFVLFISIPMCFGMSSVSDLFIPLFLGDGYEKSAILLSIFSILMIVVGLNNAVGKQILMPIGRQNEYNISVIVGAIVNFILNYLLIPQFLSIGAAVASVLAETIILLIFLYYARDFISLSWLLRNSLNYLLAALVMTGVIRSIFLTFKISWPNFIIRVVLGIIIYFACLAILKDEFFYDSLKIIRNKIFKRTFNC